MQKYNFIIYLSLLILFCHSCTSPKPPLSEESLIKINKELGSWAEGRWSYYKASYETNNSTLVIQIIASPQSNEVALSSYCKILKDLANEYANGYNFVGKIFVLGTLKKSCH